MIEASVVESILSLPKGSAVVMSTAQATIASPSWWGGDSDRFIARVRDRNGSRDYLVKVMQEHTRAYIDWETSFECAKAAGTQDVGPKVAGYDYDQGILIMEDLTPRAATATVDAFDGDGIAALVELRKYVRKLAFSMPKRTVFDEIDKLEKLVGESGQRLPPDMRWMRRRLNLAAERISTTGHDLVACHGDGNASNVMVMNDSGGLRMLDWDCAGLMDPLQDLGSMLLEFCPDDRRARPVFEMYWGVWDESLFDRSRIYGLADCVRWGLIGLYCDRMLPGTQEYSKFSDWQFLRARTGLSEATYALRVLNL